MAVLRRWHCVAPFRLFLDLFVFTSVAYGPTGSKIQTILSLRLTNQRGATFKSLRARWLDASFIGVAGDHW